MLVLGDDEVCQLLHMKERGEDPTDGLFEIADEFLCLDCHGDSTICNLSRGLANGHRGALKR